MYHPLIEEEIKRQLLQMTQKLNNQHQIRAIQGFEQWGGSIHTRI
jgi:hypothetical protein